MTEISCEMCMDLIPLVRDGIASKDSEQAVQHHLEHCETCSAFFDGNTPPASDAGMVYRKFRRKTQWFFGMVLLFGLCFGFTLSGDGDLFYNVLLMPVLGAMGYYLFRWKALYQVPMLLLGIHAIMNALGLVWQGERLDFGSLLLWTMQYCIFVLLGIVIAGLLHFALRKEE